MGQALPPRLRGAYGAVAGRIADGESRATIWHQTRCSGIAKACSGSKGALQGGQELRGRHSFGGEKLPRVAGLELLAECLHFCRRQFNLRRRRRRGRQGRGRRGCRCSRAEVLSCSQETTQTGGCGRVQERGVIGV